jgi:hypothetical protein
MATIPITVPQDFFKNMNQFMANVQKMQQLTDKFLRQAQQLSSAQSLILSHKAMTSRMSQLLQVLRKISASLQRTLDMIVNALGPTARIFMRSLALAGEVLGPIIAISIGIGGMAISAAMFGMKWFWDKMVSLGDSMLQDFLLASGSLSSIGGLRAFRAAFGGLPGDLGLPGMVQARGYQASPQFAALKLLGIKAQADTIDMMLQTTLAAAAFMKRQPKGLTLGMAEATGLTSIFSPERLMALREMDEKELQAYKEVYERYKPLMQITDKVRKSWMNFSFQIKAAGAQIVAIIVEKLADPNAPFTQAVTHLSESIVKFFRVFMETPLTKKLIERLGYYIDEFAKWMKKPETTQTIEKLIEDIGDIVKSTIEAISYLKQIVEMFRGVTPEHLHGRRALAQQLGMEHPGRARAEFVARHPGMARFTHRIGIERPAGAPPAAVPSAAPISRYPGRERFHEKIGIARPPTAPRISPRTGKSEISSGRRGYRGDYGDIKPSTGTLREGQVNSSDLYNSYKEKFKNSSLNGYVPKDGARWGITKGTPEEWARLATATSKQESGLNSNAGGGGLNQFQSNDLRNYGVSGSVNDPNVQVDALVNQWSKHIRQDGVVSQPAPGNDGRGNNWLGAGRYFGSMRDQGWHGKKQADVDKHLGENGWADKAQRQAEGKAPPPRVPVGGDAGGVSRTYERRKGEPGEFNYAATGALGAPGQNLTTVTFKDGQTATVNKNVAERYTGFVNEMIDKGYPVDLKGGGGYADRGKRGGGGLSMHSYGAALDINVSKNAYKGSTTDLPSDVEETAWKHGLSWGGRFGDPMHFEPMSPEAWEHKRKILEGQGKDQTTATTTPSPSVQTQWPDPKITRLPERTNPVDHVKIDNRSDHDISETKTHSDNDSGKTENADQLEPADQ